MKPVGPPRIAVWILEHLVPGESNDALLGDLWEEFCCGRSAAWYWRQVLAAVAIGLLGEMRVRLPALGFATLWMLPAQWWSAFALWHAARYAGYIVPWPYSLVVGMIIPIVLSLWAGLIVFGLICSSIGQNLSRRQIWRGLWIGPLTFFFLTISVRMLSHWLGLGVLSVGAFSFAAYFPSLVAATWKIGWRVETSKAHSS
ncbi:MAG TPA: hypothetical protein VGN16_01985 [Acidobacteriaceae bacterium]|jgi:hypothetical protein